MIAQLHTPNQTHPITLARAGSDLLITSPSGKQWLRISGVDWPALAAEPGIIRAESAAPPEAFDRRPTLADVPAGDPLTAWQMIYLRFRDHENEAVREIAYAAAGEYQKLIGNSRAAKGAAAIEAASGAAEAEALTQLEQDLAVCRPAAAAILSAQYPQAEIGRRLGVANAGSYRQRILDVLGALDAPERRAA